jgi:hypothetical protein
MDKPRYEVRSMRTRVGIMYYVVDTHDRGTEVHKTRDERSAHGRAETLNAAPAPAATVAPAAAPALAPGWSNAAKRRAGTLPARDVVGGMLGRSSHADPDTCHYTGLSTKTCDCCN